MTLLSATADPIRDRGTERLLWAAGLSTVGLLVLRLALTSYFPFVTDEAYYWVWSKHLALGYPDHPPMLAYWIRLGTALFGDNEFGVRFLFVLSVGLDALILYRTALVLFADRAVAAWTVLFFNATLIAAAALLAGPDQPLCLFWALAVYGLARIARGGAPAWWLLIGAMSGLAVASKLTALFLGASIVVWLAATPSLRGWLFRPWPYLGGAVAGLVVLPLLLWNAGNDWVTFSTQFRRINPGAFDPLHFVDMMGALIGLATPFIAIAAAAGIVFAFARNRWLKDEGLALLLALFVPFFAYFAYYGLYHHVEGNWFAPLIMEGCLLAGLAARQAFGGAWGRIVGFSVRGAVPLGLAVGFAAYALGAIDSPLIPADKDPLRIRKGWPSYFANAERVRREVGADYITSEQPWLMMFYLPDVPVYGFGRPPPRIDLPTLEASAAGRRGLYVNAAIRPAGNTSLAEHFAVVGDAPDVARRIDGVDVPHRANIVEGPRPGLTLFRSR